MASFSPLPLTDLCRIRVAYLMWTRSDITKVFLDEDDWEELQECIQEDILKLHLPQQLKTSILSYVKISGENLIFLLSLWLSKTQPMSTEKWLPADILFDCIVLNGDGLLNYRKTAETILRTKMLHNVFAFRLACVNFLEVEVLKLWPIVMLYFLNKMVLEGEHTQIINEDFSFLKSFGVADWRDFPVYDDPLAFFNIEANYRMPCTFEPAEVLYWIYWCLLKENVVSLPAVPYYTAKLPPEEFLLRATVFSGNVAYFHYCRSRSSENISYFYKNIHLISCLISGDHHQEWYVSYYMLLSAKEKAELFVKKTDKTVSRFLQWPLSYTFLNNLEVIWNLIPDKNKLCIFFSIFSLILLNNQMASVIKYELPLRNSMLSSGLHMTQHLVEIFVALWKIVPNSYRDEILDSCVFRAIKCYYSDLENEANLANFDTSVLKEKLSCIFVANGEAVLELYEGQNMRESLRKIVKKYIPKDYSDLDSRWISFVGECVPKHFRIFPWFPPQRTNVDFGNRVRNMARYEIDESFLIYVKNLLLPPNDCNISDSTYLYFKSI